MKKSKVWLGLSVTSFIVAVISVISGFILSGQRKSGAEYEVVKAFDGTSAVETQRFMSQTLPQYLIVVAFALFIIGIILLVVHFVKSRKNR